MLALLNKLVATFEILSDRAPHPGGAFGAPCRKISWERADSAGLCQESPHPPRTRAAGRRRMPTFALSPFEVFRRPSRPLGPPSCLTSLGLGIHLPFLLGRETEVLEICYHCLLVVMYVLRVIIISAGKPSTHA